MTKKQAFNDAAHNYYINNTSKTFEELSDYLSYDKFNWADGCHEDAWENIEHAQMCGVEAASQYLEIEINEG